MFPIFFKNSAWVISGSLFAKISSFCMLALLAQILGTKDFGIYAAILATVASVQQICDLGISVVLQRLGAKIDTFHILETKKLSVKMTTLLLLLVTIVLSAWLTLVIFEDFFNKIFYGYEIADQYFKFLPYIFLLQVLTEIPLKLIAGGGFFKKLSLRVSLQNLLLLIVLPTSAYLFGLKGMFTGYIVIGVINCCITLKFVLDFVKKYNLKFELNNTFKTIKSILSEGLVNYLGNTLAGALLGILVIRLISQYLDISFFSYVRIGLALGALLSFIPTAIQPVTLHFLIKHKDKSSILQYYQFKYILLFTLISISVLVPFLEYLTPLVYGEKYINGIDVITIVFITSFFNIGYTTLYSFSLAKDSIFHIGIIGVTCVSLAGLVAYFTIPIYEGNGYIMYYLVFQISYFIIFYRERIIKGKIPIKISDLLIMLFFWLWLLAFAVIQNDSFLFYTKILLIPTLLFVTFYYLLDDLVKNEIKKLIKRIRKTQN